MDEEKAKDAQWRNAKGVVSALYKSTGQQPPEFVDRPTYEQLNSIISAQTAKIAELRRNVIDEAITHFPDSDEWWSPNAVVEELLRMLSEP